jgi:SpoVK/Ycf46/Vps4 family AAA+-type ATPase
MTETSAVLPTWAEELRRRYLKGEASQFVLHGNVHDLVLFGGKLLQINEFLSQALLVPKKDVVVHYDLSSGVRFAKKKGTVDGLDDLLLQKSADKVLPALERLLLTVDRAALIIEFAEMICPVGDPNFFSETDRQSVIALQRWAMSPQIAEVDSLVLLLTENLSELNPKLVSNPRTAAVKVPMPELPERAAVIRFVNPGLEAAWVDRLAEVTAGLRAVQIKAILEPPPQGADDPAERERYIAELLGQAPNAAERAKKLAAITQGMSKPEIKELVNPAASEKPKAAAETDAQADVLRLIYKRKREIIERECFGLIEFVDPPHDFSVVGGIEEVKKELLTVARYLREGRTARCPMGILFTGPMGTGKTFVAEAFVKETGLTAIKFKNFRSKWVGATEGNLEKILSVVQAIGQVIVIIDEGDRAFGGGGEEDGGTSSRVIGRIKEFMSDTTNRGRVLFILMTNRPDKLDVDIKRAGRLDRKIPFLYPQSADEVEGVLLAQLKKNKVKADLQFPRDRAAVSERLLGYSNADIEAVVLLANDYAQDAVVTPGHFGTAIQDYLPSRDVEMLEYMELIAVFEASNRRMLPKKYADLSVEELQQRVALLRAKVGNRR